MKIRLALPAAILAVGALLTACTTGGMSNTHDMSHASSTSAGEHNAQDVMFAQMMIVHHEGAIQMADLAPSRAASTEVKELAATIKAAQQPEIDQMTSWLEAWGEPLTMHDMDMSTPMPTNSSDSHDMHGSHDMPGMTDDDMASLKSASGAAFDKQFLTLMIEHHQGAITMAEEEQSGGKDSAAKKLADSIISSQTEEIADMEALLDTLG